MKTMMNIFAVVAMLTATTMNVNATEYTNVAENDTVVTAPVIDNSADDELINEFVATGEKFDAKSRKHATYEDATKALVGNSSVPVELDARPQGGWFGGLGVAATGTFGANSFGGVMPFLTLGYEGNKDMVYGRIGYLSARPNEQSDFQGRFNALEFDFGYGRSLKQWRDHHLRLKWVGELHFRSNLDRKDLGSYSTETVAETETEIITTRETGWKAYTVKPYMFGATTGLELSYQFYKLPLAIKVGGDFGLTTQLANDDSINGSASGIKVKPTGKVNLTVVVHMTKKSKNHKAQGMIRH